MQLVITSYLDRSPAHVQRHLETHVTGAVREAADRVETPSTAAETSLDDGHAVIHGGFDVVDGAQIDWEGDDDLTTVRVRIPWTPAESKRGRQMLAANRFTQVLTTSVRDAA